MCSSLITERLQDTAHDKQNMQEGDTENGGNSEWNSNFPSGIGTFLVHPLPIKHFPLKNILTQQNQLVPNNIMFNLRLSFVPHLLSCYVPFSHLRPTFSIPHHPTCHFENVSHIFLFLPFSPTISSVPNWIIVHENSTSFPSTTIDFHLLRKHATLQKCQFIPAWGYTQKTTVTRGKKYLKIL